nr:retinol dehydrogenase 11-like [Nerophis lumbriciformis]
MDMSSKVCIVTGANTGIGRVTALELARQGAEVVMMCRSEEKTMPVLEEIVRETEAKVSFAQIDLGSLASVRAAAKRWLATDKPIHVLVNNAGLAGHQGVTSDGFEMHFGVNHLGHFLLTKLLEPRIRTSTPARIVNVASTAHYRAKGIDYDAVQTKTASATGLHEYQVSKLANVMYSVELARRLEGSDINVYSLHPGVVASDVWRRVPWPIRPIMKRFMITNEEGAKTTIHCATSDEAAQETGLYYDSSTVKPPNPLVRDRTLTAELWEKSEAFIANALGE